MKTGSVTHKDSTEITPVLNLVAVNAHTALKAYLFDRIQRGDNIKLELPNMNDAQEFWYASHCGVYATMMIPSRINGLVGGILITYTGEDFRISSHT